MTRAILLLTAATFTSFLPFSSPRKKALPARKTRLGNKPRHERPGLMTACRARERSAQETMQAREASRTLLLRGIYYHL